MDQMEFGIDVSNLSTMPSIERKEYLNRNLQTEVRTRKGRTAYRAYALKSIKQEITSAHLGIPNANISITRAASWSGWYSMTIARFVAEFTLFLLLR
eukprot:13509033-Ditylum_brightwellii.AAC.1